MLNYKWRNSEVVGLNAFLGFAKIYFGEPYIKTNVGWMVGWLVGHPLYLPNHKCLGSKMAISMTDMLELLCLFQTNKKLFF